MQITRTINRLDAHHKLVISVIAAAIAYLLFPAGQGRAIHLMGTWIAYCVTNLGLSWVTILSSHPGEVKREVNAQDPSRTFIFLFIVFAAFASLFAILILLLDTKNAASKADLTLHIVLSFSSIVCSWILVHTVFTLRYAHLYYSTFHRSGQKRKPGGLDFPDENEPDFLDFTYFSFVIGMTFQVSDVEITDRRIRRLALVQGLLAFAFNTILVALSINIVSGLVQAEF